MEKKRAIRIGILSLIVLAAAYYGFKKVAYMMNNEETENSQLETNIVPVLPKVGGWVTAVRVKDNQQVKAGDTLILLDQRDLQIKVIQAEAALKNAEANLGLVSANAQTAVANVGTSEAQLSTQNATVTSTRSAIGAAEGVYDQAKARQWRAGQDYERAKKLFDLKSIPQNQYDAARAEKEAAEGALKTAGEQLATAKAQLEVAQKQTRIGSAQQSAAQTQQTAAQKQIELARTQVEQRRADLDLARLQLSYAVVTAPVSGQVSRKNVELGQLVNAGQPLMSIVDDNNLWVIANFKETQIGKMRVGQSVKLYVDAYPERDFEGKIESFAAATGAKFSLLPPDNSSGNFVKVVQRIPAKIILEKQQEDTNTPLRAGMSVVVTVPVD